MQSKIGCGLCRFCGTELEHSFVDLSMSPLCESYVDVDKLNYAESFYPLHVRVCANCFLVQLDEYVAPAEIFSEYAYFSSYSESWVRHAERYVASVSNRFDIDKKSLVMEIASNDGYLLQHFVKRGVKCLGIEPAANVAEVAIKKGVPTIVGFFGTETATRLVEEYGPVDLLLGNNVLAHVPDINDFLTGMKYLLAEHGVITMEFPHLMRLIDQNQFDTIYHEHFSYLSLFTVQKMFLAHGLTVFDLEELSTHGGSLRIFVAHAGTPKESVSPRVGELLEREMRKGVDCLEGYSGFAESVKATKRKLLSFLIDVKNRGKTIVAYGAPGKGNTLLNYCGIGTDFLDYAVDRNPYKQGKYTPGMRVPIRGPSVIGETRPDYILILPWNLQDEIVKQMSFVREWGCKFVVPIPEVKILD